MGRKILFEIQIADGFTFSEDNGITNLHLWPIPVGKSQEIDVEIEFEPSGGDVMNEAEQALDEYMKRKYPNKEYKIYYWWWKN